MLLRLLLLGTLCFFVFKNELLAQEVKTNAEGRRIVVYPDGSWRYFNLETDANLEKEIEIKAVEPELTEAQIEQKSRLEAMKISEAAKKEYNDMFEEVRSYSLKRILLEEDLATVEENVNTTPEQLEAIKADLKEAQSAEKAARGRLASAEKRWKKLEKMIDMDSGKREKAMAKFEQQELKAASKEAVVETSENKRTRNNRKKDKTPSFADSEGKKSRKKSKKRDELALDSKKQRSKKKKSKSETETSGDDSGELMMADSKIKMASYSKENDVLFNPPEPVCKLANESTDEFTGRIRRDVEQRLLFTYTDEKLRQYMKGREFLTCEAYMTFLTGGYHFITLHLAIASKNAQVNYGSIEKGSLLSIKTLDGEYLRFQSNKGDTGTYDPFLDAVVYKVTYPIGGNGVKKLSSNEVDKMRISWSSGYEDYEIYELDFFIDQLNCLSRQN